jgi:hypothetical protein
MAIQSSRSYSRPRSYLIKAGVRARAGEFLLGNLQNPFAIPLRVGPGLAIGL